MTPVAPGHAAQPGGGIFALDNSKGKYRDAGVTRCAYAFVAGYTSRLGWANSEPAEDDYDFRWVRHLLRRVNAYGKRWSLNMLNPEGTEAAYVAGLPGVTTWTHVDHNPRHEGYGVPVEKPVLWDPICQQRHQQFVEALAGTSSPTIDGRRVPLNVNPALTDMIVVVPGLGSVREGPGAAATVEISELPGYTRSKFIDAVVAAVAPYTTSFPTVHLSLPFFRVTDATNRPQLWQDLDAALQSAFLGRVGYFQEKLAAKKLSSGIIGGSPGENTQPLTSAVGRCPVTFQMLQSWLSPVVNPEATTGTIPTDAIDHGFEAFDARYFEVYLSDLDNPAWSDDFQRWARILA